MSIKMRKQDMHHGHKVGVLSVKIAEKLIFDNKTCSNLYKAGLLHDYGKALIDQDVLNKKGKLTEEEYELIKPHARLSAEIAKKQGYNQYIVDSILYHHENHDGTGYNGLIGYDTHFGARILRVADMYTALTTNREYRRAYSTEQAIEIMDQLNKYFDPVIYKILKNIVLTKVAGGLRR